IPLIYHIFRKNQCVRAVQNGNFARGTALFAKTVKDSRAGIIQLPVPGSGLKYFSLSGTPCQSLASAGGSFLAVILGQIFAYSALSDSHFSRPPSVSGLIA